MSAWILPLLPAVAAGAVASTRGRRGTVGIAVGALVATLVLGVWAAVTEPTGGWRWSPLLELQLAVEGAGRVMVVLVPTIAAPVVAYAAATVEDGRTRLLSLLVAFVAAMLLLVAAADLLTLLIGWELVGAVSWALIGHHWRDPANAAPARHAFVTTRFGDLGLYAAAGLVFAATGSFAFAEVSAVPRPALDAVAVGLVLAAAAKSAQLPFAPWLFSAMAGPTSVSALLHSATMVTAGAYLLIRLGPALEVVTWFAPMVVAIGLVTALAGGIVAAFQPDAKRLLAGSTSAQHGLMFVAVGAGSTAAATAHLVAHAAFKSLLFLAAGVAIHAAGTGRLSGMRAAGRVPAVAALSAVGALALAAVPPLGGAWSKEQVLAAAVHASGWAAAGVLVAGFLSALYAARFQLLAFGLPSPTSDDSHRLRVSGAEVAALAVLAGITVGLSVVWLPGAAPLVEGATAGSLGEVRLWEVALGFLLAVTGLLVAAVAFLRGRLGAFGVPHAVRAVAAGWFGVPVAARAIVVEPTLRLAAVLATFDDRVVDAGVRGVARATAGLSRLVERVAEWRIDAAVRAVAAGTLTAASASRALDERGVDAVVEGTAGGVGVAGRWSRKAQTGLAHQYYVVIAGAIVVVVIVLALMR